MSWEQPRTEEDWQECLSAYLDGELPAEEARFVEKHLENDALRAGQLDALRRTRAVLAEWQVAAPEPPPAFVREMRAALGDPRVENAEKNRVLRKADLGRLFPGGRLRWLLQAAVFLAGIGTGIAATVVLERGGSPADVGLPGAGRATGGGVAGVQAAVSPRRADELFREVAAGELKARFTRRIRAGQWQTARDDYRQLLEHYGDTQAARDLLEDRDWRLLQDRYAELLEE